jgi:predicted RNA-binding Zn-ribbon protein involved in translation (DUF1610 family)
MSIKLKSVRCPVCREEAMAHIPRCGYGRPQDNRFLTCKRCGFMAYIPLAAAEKVQEAK